MRQNAQVVALLENNTAKVRVERVSACGHDCSSCEGCGLQAAPIEAIAQNAVGAEVGDIVSVESGSQQVIGLAVLTYLLPVLMLFLVFAAARVLGASETLCGVLGVVGFLLGLFGAVYSNRRGQIPTVITEIVKKG